MQPFRFLLAIGFLMTAGLFGPAVISAQNSRRAATELSEVDPDFYVQGEYSGRAVENTPDGPRTKKFGLQVVAQGGGEFAGKLYPGGLPGSGWDRETVYSVSGRRNGDSVELAGDGLQIVIAEGNARLASAENQLVGQLNKVRRQSPTLDKRPPAGAEVIFDGEETEYLKGARITEDGLLQEGVELTKLAQDFQLHLEFRLPYMPYAKGQGRANSGVYLHKRYEVQILDSFGLEGAFNEAGALYREHKPLLNMCLPPLQWQTYDIAFKAPRFDQDGNKVENARVTVLLNGVPVHDNLELASATGGGKRVGEGPNPLPINLQNHGNPVRFRNIWMVDFTESETEDNAKPAASIASKSESAKPATQTESRKPVPASVPIIAAPYPYNNYVPDTLFPGGMVPAGVVPYYVPGYYAAPMPAPVVWGW